MDTQSIINRIFGKKSLAPRGPLYDQVKRSMTGAQAYARSHGGEIELINVTEDGDVILRLHGTCKSCPLSAVTLKLGVERELRSSVSGIKKVIQG